MVVAESDLQLVLRVLTDHTRSVFEASACEAASDMYSSTFGFVSQYVFEFSNK